MLNNFFNTSYRLLISFTVIVLNCPVGGTAATIASFS